ncbi:MAG: TnsA endonuclease N-terminal domain-containing protein [Sulfurovaceae bacterium]
MEFDDTVDSYQEQPQIEIILNGKKKTYSGDCFVKRTRNSNKKDAIVEVKYTGDIEKEKNYYIEKFKAIEEATSKLNLEFIVYTEKTDNEIYISNIDFLYRYKLYPVENKYNDILKTKIVNNKITANNLVSNITDSITEYSAISNALWSLIAHQVFKTDLNDSKLTMNSIVEPNNGNS